MPNQIKCLAFIVDSRCRRPTFWRQL